MGVILSHLSALEVTRALRSQGTDMRTMDTTPFVGPSTWAGKRWTIREFNAPEWKWPVPSTQMHLHLLVPHRSDAVRMAQVKSHVLKSAPPKSILWIDGYAFTVCPELLFVQLANELSFARLVLLGYELCGNFSRDASNPRNGDVTMQIPPATNVEQIQQYLAALGQSWGCAKAKRALEFVCDHALSAPEAVLGTIYSLPVAESGYGMGPVTLNDRVRVGDDEHAERVRHRFPDLTFSFAPVGINYDGKDHLDLKGLVQLARKAEIAGDEEQGVVDHQLQEKMASVRAKVVDDMRRNRELASSGKIVFPLTKEDLYGAGNLDSFTRQLLQCARTVFNARVDNYERILDDTDLTNDRNDLLSTLLPSVEACDTGYGSM